MKQLSFFHSERESVVAVLGERQLNESLNGRRTKQGFCVMSQDKLYWGGHHFFQNYVGDWTESDQQSSEDLSNITAVNYQNRRNPTRARQNAVRLSLTVFALSVLGALLRSRGSEWNDLFFLLLTFTAAVLLSVFTALRTKKTVMLDIEFGCELLSVETAWYDKGELDAFYNQLIQNTSDAHVRENGLSGMDLEETYGGKKILAEFGAQYREQYLKDHRCQYGFCTITPGELHFGGAYSKRLLPGVWLKARKMRDIPISDISKVYYGTVGAPVLVAVLYVLALLFVLMISRGAINSAFRFVLGSTGISMLPVLPFWGAVLFQQKRLIVKSRQGSFGFWTHQGKMAEIRQFHKMLLCLLEAQSGIPQQTELARPEVEKDSMEGSEPLKQGAQLLREYAQLLKEGVIDQTEFDRVKAKILEKAG